MKEKVRLLQEGKRVVLIIEDSTPEDVEKIKSIVGDIVLESIEGISPNPARDIQIPQPPKPNVQSNVAQETPAAQQNGPVVFANGRYAGKTLAEPMSRDCGYVHWLAENKHTDFKWTDFYHYLGIWHNNAKTAPFSEVCYMIKTLDLRPTATESIQIEIANSLGIGSLTEIKSQVDEDFVRNLLISVFDRMKKR